MALTVQALIAKILSDQVLAYRKNTVDTIKSGDPDSEITGIVTTFLATREVLEKAKALGANFVITHEPTFYNHADETDWLIQDPVYLAKKKFLEENKIIVWRYHDLIHDLKHDGIVAGMMEKLSWNSYQEEPGSRFLKFPGWTARRIAENAKKSLGISMVRVAGDPDLVCRRVSTLFGSWDGRMQMGDLGRDDVDALVCGEIREWETCEYVRDACAQGRKKALIVLGHAPSEESGMEHFARWLSPRVGPIPVHFVPAGNPFQIL